MMQVNRPLQISHSLRDPTIPVVIVTKDRTDQLLRCIASVARSRSVRSLTVIDGSHSSDREITLQSMLSGLQRRYGKEINLVGASKRRELVRRIVSDLGCDGEVVEFGLNESAQGFSAGSARNLALCLHAGERFAMIDDDVIPIVADQLNTQERIYLTPHFPFHITTHFATRQEAVNSAQWTSCDIFEEFSEKLGKSVDEIVSAGTLEKIECFPDGSPEWSAQKIGIVQCGAVGDSGSFTGDWMVNAADNYKGADRRYIKKAISSREVISLPIATYATTSAMCMAIAMGVDNSNALPPFLPQFRNEDGIFGLLVAVTLPSCWKLHLPLAVMHASATGRNYESSVSLRTSELLTEAIKISTAGGCPTLCELGERLIAIASDKYLFERERAVWTRQVFDHKRTTANRLKDSENKFISRHGRQLEKRFAQLLSMPTQPSPIEFPGIKDRNASNDRLRCFIEKFGRFLCLWPTICKSSSAARKRT